MSSANEELITRALAGKVWAVAGANADPERYGYKVWRALREHGYTVYPLNPSLGELEGDRCYPSIADVPARPDVLAMVVNPRAGITVMEDAARAGVPCVWLQPGTRSDEIRDFATRHGIELVEDCVLRQLRGRSSEDQTRRK